MEILLQWDRELLVFINQNLQNSYFDLLLPIVRNKFIWLPVYIAIITYIFSEFNIYRAYYYVIFIIFSVIITDFVSGKMMKHVVERERPCQEEIISSSIQTRVYCSRSYSFPSAHAANHFGLAVILTFLLAARNRKWQILFFSWAGIISFAQIYVGIHYPLDVLAGAILGIALIRLYIALIDPIIRRLNKADFEKSSSGIP